MSDNTLHIVNGDSLTKKMQTLNLPGDVIVWREMLCEGPCTREIDKEFFKLRKKFLRSSYGISAEDYQEEFISEIAKLKKIKACDDVVLWFEFDLFCHINMIAVINLLTDINPDIPFYLVGSKKLYGEKEFQPLSQLKRTELNNHYQNRFELTSEDIEHANLIWQLYCGNDPMKLKSQIKVKTNFEYLSSCLRAHIERFPNSVTGLNSLECNILKLIATHTIKDLNHLLGYALQYQGYYGYNDSQMERLLKKLRIFYTLKQDRLHLTDKGKQALEGKKNFYRELRNDEFLGGVKMYDFLYESEANKLLKL